MHADVDKIGELGEKLLQFLDREHADVLTAIRDSRDITEETEAKLKSALESFTESHGLKK